MRRSIRARTQKITNWDSRGMKVCGNKPLKRRISKSIRSKEKHDLSSM